MTSLLLASGNPHKAAEIRQILGPRVRVLTLRDFPGAPAPPETAETFDGNARLKAEGLAAWLSAHPPDTPRIDYVLADDSGLEVDALDGAPGVHSARFAGGGGANSPDSANNAKLLRCLEGVPPERRTARFRCVLALRGPLFSGAPGRTSVFEGACEGRVALRAAGVGGFGYDPLFVPEGCAQSFAELGEDVKNKISHRARALEKLARFLAPA